MNQLITTNYNDNGEIIVSGRELHEFLGVKEKYTEWFKRMLGYGFAENTDFVLVSEKTETNNPRNPFTTITNHALKLDMAKEISMIQRNEKGKQARQYFIEIEKRWNSPEMIMKRALEYADAQIKQLTTTNLVLEQRVNELQPKATYYDLILQNKSLLSTSVIAKDYGMSAITLNKKLHELGVQYKQGDIWLLYAKYQDKGYTQTYMHAIDAEKSKPHTKWTQQGRLFIYDLLKGEGIVPTIERDYEEVN
ncbi:phage antirepressor KilAC domain-containing protein [Lysinibacillus sphaericus]|uniref:phage antirepressor KilAC domain-containing protein n=1 Tax=Lysinibacillus sphaericus TaxID=1421 RepID=UPI003D725404